MSAVRSFASVAVGDELPAITLRLQRSDLVRYAGASGDFNPIHYNDRFAREVGLPDVLAHGMLTMGQAARILTEWAGDPGAVVEYGVKFTRPVVVPDPGEAVVEVTASVTELLDANRVKVALAVKVDDQAVLGKAQAVVQLA